MDYNKLAKEIYTNNVAVGWWDGDVCIYEKMQLISTEIAEATEGERKDLMDDKLPHRKMAEVELADALIRTLDLGGRLDLTYKPVMPFHPFINAEASKGKQHLGLNLALIRLADVYDDYIHWMKNPHTENPERPQLEKYYSWLITLIVKCAEINGYDIEAAMAEKREFNKARPDHQRENREMANGKKF